MDNFIRPNFPEGIQIKISLLWVACCHRAEQYFRNDSYAMTGVKMRYVRKNYYYYYYYYNYY